ncbi:MAG: J domain-containing protein [Maricaulaceae bacterium]|nr:J domain-containing protein [Maricaulaceae bacterium]
MDGAFEYKPRWRDIRIKPPKGEAAAEDRVCEWPGCGLRGDARAPKAADRLTEYHWFCASHAGEYNKAWNYFEGMSDADLAAFNAGAAHGHRPTWSFRANTGPAKRASKASADFREGFSDPFGIFRGGRGARRETPRERKLGRMQEMALETMQLNATAKPEQIRKRYAELVKLFHPDANGGDRSCEEQLGRVIRAYQILKSGGMA